jgi:hypothetical protein
VGTKEARKQAKQGGKKPNNKEKNPNGGKEEKNKKRGFHEMATKFFSLGQIFMAAFNGN